MSGVLERASVTRAAVLLLTCLSVLFCARTASAQTAPHYFPPGHWTWDAVRRLNILGVAPPSADPILTAVTAQHARHVFETAADSADSLGLTSTADLARDYLAMLDSVNGDPDQVVMRAGIGGTYLQGQHFAAEHNVPDFVIEPPRPLESVRSPLLAVDVRMPLGAIGGVPLALQVDGAAYSGGLLLPTALLTMAAGPFDVWLGRQSIHYGAGRSGGVVTGSGWDGDRLTQVRTQSGVTGAGVAVRRPFHFPGVLRILGPDRIELVAGRLDRVGDTEDGYAVFGRLIGSPFHRRFTLGLNRGALFGGTGKPVTLRRLLGIAIGEYGSDESGLDSGFENQVISGVTRLRLPTERVLPVEVFLEWGADDMAGAVGNNPGLVMGVDVAAVPGVPELSLNAEHSQYTANYGGEFREWYIGRAYDGSWSDAGRIFAHPLGGVGREWRVRAAWSQPERGLHAALSGWDRHRHGPNLFAPNQGGYSRGASVAAEWLSRDWMVRGWASLERGDGWSEEAVVVRFSRTMRR